MPLIVPISGQLHVAYDGLTSKPSCLGIEIDYAIELANFRAPHISETRFPSRIASFIALTCWGLTCSGAAFHSSRSSASVGGRCC